nr:NIa-Pro protease [Barley yellow mosaic virus]
ASTGILLSQVGVDVATRVGRISIGTFNMNCYFYNDWILVPGHLQDRSGNVTIQFPDQTVQTTTDALNANGVKRFYGLDVIAIRRPAILRPRTKLVKAFAIEEPVIAQMVFVDAQGVRKFTQSDWARKGENSGRWSHKISTVLGMCGCQFWTLERQIDGIHVATNYTKKRNEFQPFTQEVVDFINGPGTKIPYCPWVFDRPACGYASHTALFEKPTTLTDVIHMQ